MSNFSISTKNASQSLSGSYIGTQVLAASANPFVVTPATPTIVKLDGSFVPAIDVKTSVTSYNPFSFDFTTSNSFTFADNCTSNITG